MRRLVGAVTDGLRCWRCGFIARWRECGGSAGRVDLPVDLPAAVGKRHLLPAEQRTVQMRCGDRSKWRGVAGTRSLVRGRCYTVAGTRRLASGSYHFLATSSSPPLRPPPCTPTKERISPAVRLARTAFHHTLGLRPALVRLARAVTGRDGSDYRMAPAAARIWWRPTTSVGRQRSVGERRLRFLCRLGRSERRVTRPPG